MGTAADGALHGFRVLDASQILSGPLATRLLADQGADVIKIEPPAGDLVRHMGGPPGLSPTFATVNRSKRSLVLDLNDERAVAVLHRMVEQADVFVQNLRPGTADRMGIGAEALMALNSRLIYVSISGFGHTGPYRNKRVYDPLIQATSGTPWAQRDGGDPTNVRTIIFDKVTALTTAQGITAALLERERTGMGQHLPITMLESALSYQWADVMWSQTLIGDDVAEAASHRIAVVGLGW